jgi:phage-related minor tail protein
MPNLPGTSELPPAAAFSLTADTQQVERQFVRLAQLGKDAEQQFARCAQAGQRFGNTLATAFVDLTLKGKGFGDVLRTVGLRLSELALKTAFQPLTDAIGGALQRAITGGIGGAAFAKGGVIQRGLPVPFANGGVIASPIAFPLAGNRVGIAGERGAEAILPLARGPDGRLGVRADGSGGINVTFNVTTPDADSFRRSETQLAAMLARAVAQGQRNL